MSSFNINGPSNNQPLVQSSQNLGKDGGGGGNTGYMNMRGGKKKNQNEEDNSVFLEEEIEDTFTRSDKKKPQKKGGKILGAIANLINKDKKNNIQEKDSFVRQNIQPQNEPTEEEPNEDEEGYESEEEYNEYEEYNVPLQKTTHLIEDDEYEVVEDNYYDDIDV